MKENKYQYLLERAQYALRSHSRDLVCEVYGMALMARGLEAITHEEYMDLNDLLIAKGLNDPAHCRLE